MSLDTEAPLASVSAAHLYTMPDTGSVHAALDLEEALDYLSGSLNLPAESDSWHLDTRYAPEESKLPHTVRRVCPDRCRRGDRS
jgi:hypothetical protein